ncbi:MAG: dipicolinate synthase subunit B [Oscillospiraceae bacterium]|nr:dipicolinate synthase subunit B [Oscillospiraceae bacterium]
MIRLGFALCGSFCTFDAVLPVMRELAETYEITPILSPAAAETDTRFGLASRLLAEVRSICGRDPILRPEEAEPIGPKGLLDILAVVPCTGNTMAKLAAGAADTVVTFACKAQLRNARPIVLGVSTNDGLAAGAANLGQLLNRKHYYFVPFRQDDPLGKPTSLVSNFALLPKTLEAALGGRQLQPMLLPPD